MAQRTVRTDLIPDPLFEYFNVGKAAIALATPDQRVVHPNLEQAGTGRLQAHLAQLVLKGGQQLLSYPAATEQPAAQRAVADQDAGFFRRCRTMCRHGDPRLLVRSEERRVGKEG